jgi:catalase
MTQDEAKTFEYNPFDLTKVWPHAKFPLIDVGVLELNQIPKNYFADVEQSAFAPAHVVDGISYSPDKMLQGRLLSYPDAHRYRLGANYEQIPVNRCPYMVANYQRDGLMRVDGNGEDAPNYSPNSFDGIYADEQYKQAPMPLESNIADWYDRNAEGENDHYTQPGLLYSKVMNDYDRHNLVSNIVGAMSGISGEKKDLIINRQLCHFFRANVNLGTAVAKGLGVNVEAVMAAMKH